MTLWIIRHQRYCFLELIPPAFNDKVPIATEKLFIAVHGLSTIHSVKDRFLKRTHVISLEIVSSRRGGIRYIIRVPETRAEDLTRQIHAYMPDVTVHETKEYLDFSNKKIRYRVVNYAQKAHFAYPLRRHDILDDHDPIAYLTSAMTQLSKDEMMSLHILINPVLVQKAEKLHHQILQNEDVVSGMDRQKSAVVSKIIDGINAFLFGIIDMVGDVSHGNNQASYYSGQKELDYEKQVAKRTKPVRTLSYFEHELVSSIKQKLSQPLFRTDICLYIMSSQKAEIKNRQRSIESAFMLFSVSKNQRLGVSKSGLNKFKIFQNDLFKNRMPNITRRPSLLSASEIASLYHFPHSLAAKTENVVKSLSKTLPAPLSLKNGRTLDIFIGENNYHGVVTPIGLTLEERQRHMYVIGGTGSGKTTMLQYAIMQDIESGKGIAVIDPHGDLAETILRHIPYHRIKDVIYFNPDDLSYPIGINLLELSDNVEGDELLREKDLITESVVSIFRKIFSDDDSGGHRIEYVLRNTIQTALTIEGSTLFTIFRLLNDAKFRRVVVKTLHDEDLKNFWNNELGKAGEFQKVKMAAGITAKIGRFLFSASARKILEQEKSTINFEDIINNGQILICNFSKGLLGEDTSALFGTAILAKLQVAALRRARIHQGDRQAFYLYVDEFQNFATTSFVQMLSEARKYKLYLTMAEQSTSQQDQQRLVDIILANVGTVVCFRSGSPSDERFILPLFSPYIEQGEIANLPAYNFYTRIAAVETQEPMSGRTIMLKGAGSESVKTDVIKQSRELYALKSVNRLASNTPTLVKEIPKKTTNKSHHTATSLKAVNIPTPLI
ncbi:MAG: hypothetical protein NVS3B23_04190 [Candidatus Saccharimonadales bacterium]